MIEKGKRKNKRVEFHTTVSASFQNGHYEKCALKDLSMGGVFIYGVTDQEEGNLCDLVLHLTGTSDDMVVKVKGKVARITKEGVGINFREIDIDSLSHLKNIVYYNTPNPDQLNETDLAWNPPRND